MISNRLIIATALGSVVLLLVIASGMKDHPWYGITVITLFGGLFVTFVATILYGLWNAPVAARVVLLGYPMAGKTTYLAVLFEEMIKAENELTFVPYGKETLEWVGAASNTLAGGEMLWATVPGYQQVLRAHITRPPFRRSMFFEIADAAGEYTVQLGGPHSGEWLHRSEFFRWAISSDAVLLAIDAPELLRGDPALVFKRETGLLVALELLAEAKVAAGKRAREPIAVLMLKDDDLMPSEHDAVLERVPRLRAMLSKRWQHVQFFFVTSVLRREHGRVAVAPANVVEPILWLLRHLPARRTNREFAEPSTNEPAIPSAG